MAEFQHHESDDLHDVAFGWLLMGFYGLEVDRLEQLISETRIKLNDVQGDQFKETLSVLGELRGELAKVLWHMNRPQHALEQIQLCISENCQQFSEVSEI